MNRLVLLSYSPWSERARWALDHHHVPYHPVEYLPMLGEPWLRLRLGKLRGRASVPVLFTKAGPVSDSWDIARYAESRGIGAPLFPAPHIVDIRAWHQRANALMEAGRARATLRAPDDPEALRESVPAPLNRVGALATATGLVGTRFLRVKYGFSSERESEYAERMRRQLEQVRSALAGREHLVGPDFSFADICVAVALQFVQPVAGYIPLGAASQRLWTEPELAAEFSDLLTWRDELFLRYR